MTTTGRADRIGRTSLRRLVTGGLGVGGVLLAVLLLVSLLAEQSMQGKIQNMKSGVFLIRFQNNQGAMSQVWIFRKDGTAGVRELPDSGELQSAVPVKDDSLTPPKKAR